MSVPEAFPAFPARRLNKSADQVESMEQIL